MRDYNYAFLNQTIPESIITQARVEGFKFAQMVSYPSQAKVDSLTFNGGVIEWKETYLHGEVDIIFRLDDGLLRICLQKGLLVAHAYAAGDEEANTLLELIKEQIPPSELNEEVVEVAFWRNSPRGALSTKRNISCPSWHDIKDNYVNSTRNALEQLMATDFSSGSAGKLVLWHGEPGTGKTYALRSWGQLCRDSMDINYIVDPDRFFGADANYMLDLLTRAPVKKWNLFVAEDTGELLARDAKHATGQALSRLLNVCDGLIGQGLRIMFLITTNEDLGTLHPAIVRPGRCHANIGFESFNASESHEWLDTRGIKGISMPSRNTIAQLYSFIENNQIVAQKPMRIGFVA